MAHLIEQAKTVIERGERVLITTLTKKMAEDLTDYLAKEMLKVRYLHSDVDSLERIELIRQLRAGEYDILIGINLLREGLDLPEVSLVAILDADKEGFLRDERSLIQTIGRAARNSNGKVILFADKITGSIQRAMEITKNRRVAQIAHNEKYGITPQTIIKSVGEKKGEIKGTKHLGKIDIERQLIELDAQMRISAAQLDFEKAIELRDKIAKLKKSLLI
jgi:excinuclease ABC subunit B